MKNKLILRTILKEDLNRIYILNSEENRGEYQEFQFDSYKNLEIEYEKNGFISREFQMLVAEYENNIIGIIYISFVREGLVRIGVVLDKNKLNKGFGTTILEKLVEHLFLNYPINRIEADTDINNLKGQKVLEKIGFKKEGILRGYRYHHGRYNDSYIYSYLREEYINKTKI